MVVYINNEIIDTKHLPVIGIGNEAKCYKYKNSVLKIYHSYVEFDKDTTLKLSKFNTKNVIMPKKLIQDKRGKYIGCTKDYFESLEGIRNMNNTDLISDLKNIKSELVLLSTNNVLLEDCNNLNNVLFDGHIRFVDFGCYTFKDNNTFFENTSLLETTLYYLLIDTIFYDDGQLKKVMNSFKNSNLNVFEKRALKSLIAQLTYIDYKTNSNKYIDYLINILNTYKNLGEYRLSLVKKALNGYITSDYISKQLVKLKKKIK